MDAFSATLSRTHVPPCLSPFPQRRSTIRLLPIRAVNSAEPAKEKKATNTKAADQDPSSSSNSSTPQLKPKKKPVYSMKKGQIVRVDKDKYLNSVNYLSVGHPPYYKGLDYIYEDRGEIAWVGVPTAPAWLPTDMLIMSEKLDYERL
ncbi:NAD(P)H-quinone oxidoreductase subunit O, chloroplastic [Linum perenne]